MIEKKDSGSKPLTVYECVRLEDCKDRWSVLSILLDNEMAAMDPEVSPVPVKEVFRCFRNLGCQVIFASERGTDVGMVVFCVQPKEVIIKELVVVPERRGKGIGKLLVQLVMEWAKDLRLFVGCLGNNERALGFYKRLGFSVRRVELGGRSIILERKNVRDPDVFGG